MILKDVDAYEDYFDTNLYNTFDSVYSIYAKHPQKIWNVSMRTGGPYVYYNRPGFRYKYMRVMLVLRVTKI